MSFFIKVCFMSSNISSSFFPAEWYPQSAVQLTWPHQDSDWAEILEEVTACYITIAKEIIEVQKLIIVGRNCASIQAFFSDFEQQNIVFIELNNNDTWARDHGGISILENGFPKLLDFKFNGWGLKFASNWDNQITAQMFSKNVFLKSVIYQNELNFVFEGGAIESDGKGTLLTTKECLLSPNRNGAFNQKEIENYLLRRLNSSRMLWLNYGYLAGDDTDSHIDTLARFVNESTIAYVKCEDISDEHFSALAAMEDELRAFKTIDNQSYKLIPLPMAKPVYDDNGRRLPATYANFLIINNKVLLPFYNSELDQVALEILQSCFPDRKVVGIDCSSLIKQNGSLHCITMQYPKEFVG